MKKEIYMIKSYLKWFFRKPKHPRNTDNRVYLHLGCGNINAPHYINIDSRYLAHVHHVRDVKNLSIFKDDSVDMIYACHVLEHISYNNLYSVLKEWYRVLKKGGILRISVPNFETMVDIYSNHGKSIELIVSTIMGGQGYKEDIHFSIFDKQYLECLLRTVGFSEIRKWDPFNVDNHDFQDWSSYVLNVDKSSYLVSLNIEGYK